MPSQGMKAVGDTALAREAEYGASGRFAACGQRKDKAAAILQAIEPVLRRPRDARIDVDDVGQVEGQGCSVAVDHRDMVIVRQIVRGAVASEASYSIAVTRPVGPTSSARMAV